MEVDSPPDPQVQAGSAATKQSWRDTTKIHPAANLFPMTGDEEIDALAANIKKMGRLTSQIIYCRDKKGHELLLDGRNRLEAAERAGYKIQGWEESSIDAEKTDPYAFVVSANIMRRHLTAEARRELIEKLLKASPEKSDRQIAEQTRSNRTTVGQVRKGLEATGDVSIVDTRRDTRGRQQPARRPSSLTSTSTPAPDKAAKRIAHAEAKARAIAHSDQLSLVYDLDRAVEHIASIDMTPAEFLKYAEHHQPNQIETAEDLARLERSVEWLTELVAIGRRRLLGVGVTTAETPAKSPAQAIADRQVENVLKLADFGADPVAADPRQLDLLALITPQQGDAKAEPAAQVPTDPVTGLPLFLKRERVTAEAAQ
jgi:hypothetical protein